MLLDFSLKNYRSFRDQNTLSMVPDGGTSEFSTNVSSISDNISILKSGLIYGANASGKSNFMKALQSLRSMILFSSNNNPDAVLTQYEPFKFNPSTSVAPITFEINFLIKKIRYFYSVSFDAESILKEELKYYPLGRVTTLFVRNNIDHFTFGDALKGQKVVVKDLTLKNQLYLSKAAQNNIQQLVEIYNYFKNDFMPIPFLDSWVDNYYADRISGELIKENENENYINNFRLLLKSFDTGIADFHIVVNDDSGYEVLIDHIKYDHAGNELGINKQKIEEESTGTQKLFVLGGLILRALMMGRVIMIDEFERSLHPLISKFILSVFNDVSINTNNAQLIISTHDTNLLDQENQLRRDQIWISEKNILGVSELFSLADLKGIKQKASYENWYLTGRFGGVPVVESLNFTTNYKAANMKTLK